MENNLALCEKLLLLAVRPEKGGLMCTTSQALEFSLTGAALLELSFSGNIVIKDRRVEVISGRSESSLQSYLLQRLTRSSKPRKLRHWLGSMSVSPKRIKAEIYQSLLEKNEIRLEDRRFLFFTWKKPYLGSRNHTYTLVDRIKTLIIQNPVNQEDICLLALLEPAELLRRIYPERGMRKQARMKIRQFLEKNRTDEYVVTALEMVKAVKATIMSRRAAHSAAVT